MIAMPVFLSAETARVFRDVDLTTVHRLFREGVLFNPPPEFIRSFTIFPERNISAEARTLVDALATEHKGSYWFTFAPELSDPHWLSDYLGNQGTLVLRGHIRFSEESAGISMSFPSSLVLSQHQSRSTIELIVDSSIQTYALDVGKAIARLRQRGVPYRGRYAIPPTQQAVS